MDAHTNIPSETSVTEQQVRDYSDFIEIIYNIARELDGCYDVEILETINNRAIYWDTIIFDNGGNIVSAEGYANCLAELLLYELLSSPPEDSMPIIRAIIILKSYAGQTFDLNGVFILLSEKKLGGEYISAAISVFATTEKFCNAGMSRFETHVIDVSALVNKIISGTITIEELKQYCVDVSRGDLSDGAEALYKDVILKLTLAFQQPIQLNPSSDEYLLRMMLNSPESAEFARTIIFGDLDNDETEEKYGKDYLLIGYEINDIRRMRQHERAIVNLAIQAKAKITAMISGESKKPDAAPAYFVRLIEALYGEPEDIETMWQQEELEFIYKIVTSIARMDDRNFYTGWIERYQEIEEYRLYSVADNTGAMMEASERDHRENDSRPIGYKNSRGLASRINSLAGFGDDRKPKNKPVVARYLNNKGLIEALKYMVEHVKNSNTEPPKIVVIGGHGGVYVFQTGIQGHEAGFYTRLYNEDMAALAAELKHLDFPMVILDSCDVNSENTATDNFTQHFADSTGCVTYGARRQTAGHIVKNGKVYYRYEYEKGDRIPPFKKVGDEFWEEAQPVYPKAVVTEEIRKVGSVKA